ncbi:hypothetical protein F4859DRAFT_464712 [Xylaria cf. heliscus]|nr:hypothetical protein F4859DRAFT_464712 [Xylaria cf. heliscus]
MAPTPPLSISCHCGAAKQAVRLREQPSGAPQDINLCHCTACRHNTGLLCVSYAGIERPGSIEGLREYYSTTKAITRFFCATCGCQVFWKLQSPLISQVRGSVLATPEPQEWWAVATGVIVGAHDGDAHDGDGGDESGDGYGEVMRIAKHINTAGTRDGGLSPFIRGIGGLEVLGNQDPPPPASLQSAKGKLEGSRRGVDLEAFFQNYRKEGREKEVLKAFCHCRMVQFQITRPNAASKLPRSNYPDLMVPYHTSSPQIQNPDDIKWWLRPELSRRPRKTETPPAEEAQPRRYLAGTCACRSCRLTSGFEIQTWAFVPRANIFFHIHESQRGSSASGSWTPPSLSESNEGGDIVPLDFEALPPDILTSYESSEGVRREFCSHCGATVFWRDRWRPEIIDVSVGLLDAAEGARAETWLDWWTERVSFAEDATNGRTGEIAKHANSLIESLAEGLRRQHEQRLKGS